jgi:hypothetical protein
MKEPVMSNSDHHHLAGWSARLAAIVLIALALGSLGCSDDDPTSPSVPEDFAHAEETTANGLKLTVSTPRATYEFGEDIEIRITLTNVSDQTQVLDFLRGDPARYPNLGLNVDDENGSAHFVDGDGERDDFPLAPGEAISATFTWNQHSRFGGAPVERGYYSAVAFVAFDDRETLRVDDLFLELD